MTSLHNSGDSFLHLPLSVQSLDFFFCFTRVYEGHLMLSYTEKF